MMSTSTVDQEASLKALLDEKQIATLLKLLGTRCVVSVHFQWLKYYKSFSPSDSVNSEVEGLLDNSAPRARPVEEETEVYSDHCKGVPQGLGRRGRSPQFRCTFAHFVYQILTVTCICRKRRYTGRRQCRRLSSSTSSSSHSFTLFSMLMWVWGNKYFSVILTFQWL